jgi:hypothetical protein
VVLTFVSVICTLFLDLGYCMGSYLTSFTLYMMPMKLLKYDCCHYWSGYLYILISLCYQFYLTYVIIIHLSLNVKSWRVHSTLTVSVPHRKFESLWLVYWSFIYRNWFPHNITYIFKFIRVSFHACCFLAKNFVFSSLLPIIVLFCHMLTF